MTTKRSDTFDLFYLSSFPGQMPHFLNVFPRGLVLDSLTVLPFWVSAHASIKKYIEGPAGPFCCGIDRQAWPSLVGVQRPLFPGKEISDTDFQLEQALWTVLCHLCITTHHTIYMLFKLWGTISMSLRSSLLGCKFIPSGHYLWSFPGPS